MKSTPAMNRTPALILCALFLVPCATARPRSTTSYNVATDTADHDGKRTTCGSYTNGASAGRVVCTSTVAVPAQTAFQNLQFL